MIKIQTFSRGLSTLSFHDFFFRLKIIVKNINATYKSQLFIKKEAFTYGAIFTAVKYSDLDKSFFQYQKASFVEHIFSEKQLKLTMFRNQNNCFLSFFSTTFYLLFLILSFVQLVTHKV
jgi:hypothetical protein